MSSHLSYPTKEALCFSFAFFSLSAFLCSLILMQKMAFPMHRDKLYFSFQGKVTAVLAISSPLLREKHQEALADCGILLCSVPKDKDTFIPKQVEHDC